MRGMSATSGQPIEGEDHLRQSIRDILSTPIGTRIGRRDYGSLLPLLIDQPMNAVGRLRLFAASAIAIARWEPRIRVTGFALSASASGAAALIITGQRLDVRRGNALTRLSLPLRSA